jgi:hypothetical protein
MMYLILSTSLAFSEPSEKGYYNETEISKASTLFAEAAKVSAPQFAKAESTIRNHASIIASMETNTALLNDESLNSWFEQNQRYMLGYRMQVSQHASMLTEDYDKEFTAAMNRAIEGLGFEGTLEICEAQAIHAMMGTAPKCDGTSFSTELANTMDNDATLQEALKSINDIPWPTPNVSPESQAIIQVTGDAGYVDLTIFVEQMMGLRMKQHKLWLESQNDSLIEAIEMGDKEAVQKAENNRKQYLERLSNDGEILVNTLEQYAKKKSGKHPVVQSVGFCGNIEALGGCNGENVTAEVIETLKSDRYWAKLQKKSGL